MNMKKRIPPPVLVTISDEIYEKKCIPFIGAGISGMVFKELKTASVVEYLTNN
jgi:hypothetical protein